MWLLYKRKITKGVYEYAWVDPSGIIKFNRVVAPIGFSVGHLDKRGLPAYGTLKDFRLVTLDTSRYSEKDVQEFLSKGWLI